VNALLDAREARGVSHPALGGAERVESLRTRKFERFAALAASDEAPIRPERLVAALQGLLPEDAVIVSDPGTTCPYMSAYYQLPKAGRHFITNRAHGALGYALPAALGAWYGRPEAKVVALMGDGSFGFVCGELETMVRMRADITFVVVSNASFGWIKASQKADKGSRYHNVDFGRTDHAAVAGAFGLRSWRVEDPGKLEATLRTALESAGPTLVDVVCQPLEEAAAPVRRWMG
jgi:acetolactate synthase-1/2/3 large subunit